MRKRRSLQTNARTVVAQVRYLPGLEIRTDSGTGEVLQVITAQAGLNSVRVLALGKRLRRWRANDQYRFSLDRSLGVLHAWSSPRTPESSARKPYYPFGETAWLRPRTGGDHKTVRYSGKERDATGLYYYGFRYYMPWLQRWLNPDPSGGVDGLNLYQMVRNSPINRQDENGTNSYDVLNQQESYAKKRSIEIIAQGLDSFPAKERDAARRSIKIGA